MPAVMKNNISACAHSNVITKLLYLFEPITRLFLATATSGAAAAAATMFLSKFTVHVINAIILFNGKIFNSPDSVVSGRSRGA